MLIADEKHFLSRSVGRSSQALLMNDKVRFRRRVMVRLTLVIVVHLKVLTVVVGIVRQGVRALANGTKRVRVECRAGQCCVPC